MDLSRPTVIQEFIKTYPEEGKKLITMASGAIALGSYTGSCHNQLNSFLFTNNKELKTRYYNLYKSIINTLEFFPKYRKKVNRGANLPKSALSEHHKVGNIVCYDGFTSTAVHNPKTDYTDTPSNYFLQKKCTQRLYISYEKNGAVPGKLIEAGSLSPSENEVLFEPGACFKIDKVYPRTDTSNEGEDYECNEGEHYNFEMTLVPKP